MLPLLEWRLKRKLGKSLASAKQSWLRQYLKSIEPLFSLAPEELPLLAFDLEMTGLTPSCDDILSIGSVAIDGRRLQLSSAKQQLIYSKGGVGQSACIHGIVDSDLGLGLAVEEAIAEFFIQARGRILLAHHAPLDISFIHAVLQSVWGEQIWLPAIDTMALEHRRLQLSQDVLAEGALRLGTCRQRYGLPVYPAHNALIDAIGCGELFLGQRYAIAPKSLAELIS